MPRGLWVERYAGYAGGRGLRVAGGALGPLPGPGRYAVSLLHDRDGNHKFGLSTDGIGFAGNPRLGWSKPHADAASATAGSGPTPITIVMNYRHGLFSFGPEREGTR